MPANKKEAENSAHKKKESEKPDFWDWLIHGKGSVAEPWPTAEEVLQDPSVKKSIEEAQEAFAAYQAKNTNQQLSAPSDPEKNQEQKSFKF